MDDTHPTIAYDSSGNGNHGIKTNITPSTFHHEGSDAPFSFQNEVGYSVDGNGYLVPRNESDLANDVLGNQLTYSGEAPMNGQLINAPCGTFDGVNDRIFLPRLITANTSALLLHGYITKTVSGFKGLINQDGNTGDRGFAFRIDSSDRLEYFSTPDGLSLIHI